MSGGGKLLVKHRVTLEGVPASVFCHQTSGRASASVGQCPCSVSRQSWGWGRHSSLFLTSNLLGLGMLRELILHIERITNWFRLEWTSGLQLVQLPSQCKEERRVPGEKVGITKICSDSISTEEG